MVAHAFILLNRWFNTWRPFPVSASCHSLRIWCLVRVVFCEQITLKAWRWQARESQFRLHCIMKGLMKGLRRHYGFLSCGRLGLSVTSIPSLLYQGGGQLRGAMQSRSSPTQNHLTTRGNYNDHINGTSALGYNNHRDCLHLHTISKHRHGW